jgi:integrase
MTTKTARRATMKRFRDAILEDYRSEEVTSTTLGLVRRLFDVLIGDLGMQSTLDFERDGLFERFHEYQAEKYAPRTQMTQMAALRKIGARGKKLGFLRRVPECPGPLLPRSCEFARSDGTIPPPEGDLCTVRAHLAANSGRWHGCRIYCLTSVVDLSGISVASAVRLRPHDVRLSDGFMTVRRGNSPPMHKPIGAELRPVLEKWLQVVDSEDWLFPADNRLGHWNPTVASKALKTACIAAGVRPFSFAQVLRDFSERSGRASPMAPRRPTLVIGAPDEPVIVFGVEHEKLPGQQHRFLSALWEHQRIDASQVDEVSGVPYAKDRARDLRKRSPQLEALIRVPGRSYPGSKHRKHYEISTKWME